MTSRRKRPGLAVVITLLTTVLAALAGLASWSAHDPWFRDPAYSSRLRVLKQRLGNTEASAAPKVFMLGTSKTQAAFASRVMEQTIAADMGASTFAFSFGNPGTCIGMQLTFLRRLIAEGLQPDLLLLEISLPFLSRDEKHVIAGARLLPHERAHLQHLGYEFRDDDAWEPFRPAWYRLRHHLVAKVRPTWNPDVVQANLRELIDDWGDACNLERIDANVRSRKVLVSRAEYYSKLQQPELASLQQRVLEEIVDLCKQRCIALALVHMPEGDTFRGWYSRGPAMRSVDGLRRLARTHDVDLVEAWEWLPDDDAYLDSHHLLKPGAARFTERLAREYVVPWLRGRAGPGSVIGLDKPFLRSMP